MENEIKVKPYGAEQVAFGLEFKNPPITNIWIGKNPGGMCWRRQEIQLVPEEDD